MATATLDAVVLVRRTINRSLEERSSETCRQPPHYVLIELERVFVQFTSGNVGVQFHFGFTDNLGNGTLLAQSRPRGA